MPHSHRVLLILVISLIFSAVSAYLLLDREWFQALLPITIGPDATRAGVFGLFFILVFDFLALVIEQIRTE